MMNNKRKTDDEAESQTPKKAKVSKRLIALKPSLSSGKPASVQVMPTACTHGLTMVDR
jgi:hypothetical protein